MKDKVRIVPNKEQIIKDLKKDIKLATEKITRLQSGLDYWKSIKKKSQEHLEIFKKDI